MADKLPSYRVPATKKPSFFNSTGVVGFMAGSLIPVPVVGSLVGAVAGGLYGKAQQNKALDNGLVVKPPTMLNKGAFIGATLGGLGLIASGGAMAIPATIMAVTGALVGGKINKNMQEKRYREAENYVAQNGEYVPPRAIAQQRAAMGQEQQPAMTPPMQPQQAQATSMAQAGSQLDPQQLAQLQALAAQGQQMAAQQPAEGMSDKLAQSRPMGPQQR